MRALRWILPFFVALLAAEIFVIEPRRSAVEDQKDTVAKLKQEYLDRKRQAVNLDLLRAQLREINIAFGGLLRELPDRYDRSFGEVLRAARNRGLRVDELLSGREHVREFYAELPASLRVSGRFHDLGRFAADVASAPNSLHLSGLSLDAGPGPGRVTLSATLRMFRYLSDEEIAAARKRALATKGGKG